jgi:hypothetical protein
LKYFCNLSFVILRRKLMRMCAATIEFEEAQQSAENGFGGDALRFSSPKKGYRTGQAMASITYHDAFASAACRAGMSHCQSDGPLPI